MRCVCVYVCVCVCMICVRTWVHACLSIYMSQTSFSTVYSFSVYADVRHSQYVARLLPRPQNACDEQYQTGNACVESDVFQIAICETQAPTHHTKPKKIRHLCKQHNKKATFKMFSVVRRKTNAVPRQSKSNWAVQKSNPFHSWWDVTAVEDAGR